MKSTQFLMPVLFVKDISISKKFYQDLFELEIENDFGANISFKDAFSIWEKKRAEEIIFNTERKSKPNELKNLELYFESHEIEEMSVIIKKKSIEMIHELKEEPWGQRTIRFYDPDKFIIEVAEPIDEVILRLSKAGLSENEIATKTQIPIEAIKKVIN